MEYFYEQGDIFQRSLKTPLLTLSKFSCILGCCHHILFFGVALFSSCSFPDYPSSHFFFIYIEAVFKFLIQCFIFILWQKIPLSKPTAWPPTPSEAAWWILAVLQCGRFSIHSGPLPAEKVAPWIFTPWNEACRQLVASENKKARNFKPSSTLGPLRRLLHRWKIYRRSKYGRSCASLWNSAF